ncbi:Histone deacetylase hda1 [Actinomortierella ambigua]|nr:Histone deacetylase hda1 [Actinomortierella ambigua]
MSSEADSIASSKAQEDVVMMSVPEHLDQAGRTSLSINGSSSNEQSDASAVSPSTVTVDPSSSTTSNSSSSGGTSSAVTGEGTFGANGMIVGSVYQAAQNGELLGQPGVLEGRSTRTGYVYDVRMKYHCNVHGDDDHPEDPRRIWRIYDALNTAGCTDRMIKVPTREATTEELELVHSDDHIVTITKTSAMSKDELLNVANQYNSIYLNQTSAFCARLSCGSLLELCKTVALGHVLNGVAIIRPPGHHAEPNCAGGFCLYNNVAVAARYLQQNFGMKKIFILDWDVHHGNGTQRAFIDDPNVLYCSLHRFENGTFYPGDPIQGAHTMVGEGPGRGKNVNIPWAGPGMGDSEYIYAFHKVVMPIAYEFAPDFVLVSAGFDAAKGDQIGENLVTPAAYGHMTSMLKSLAGGRIILALEGGYNLDSIAVSGLASVKALLNDPLEPLEPIVPNASCVQTIHEVLEVQSRYWKSLTPLYLDPLNDSMDDGKMVVALSKILSVYRREFLFNQHDMIKLPIANEAHGEDLLNNVHCTQDLYSSKPLFLFVHNLGDFCARTSGASNIIRPEKSVLVDTVAQYIDNIIKSGYELVDVVVPFNPATEDEKVELKERMTNLLVDIWDNFVYMTGYSRRIVLLAAGFGCHSMVSFMNQRQKDMINLVGCAVMVPGGEESLPQVTKRLGPWYVENSFVVVADDHPIWDRVNQRANNRVGRNMERVSDSLMHLYNTMFVEIETKLKSLPPLPEQQPMEEIVAKSIRRQDGKIDQAEDDGPTTASGLQEEAESANGSSVSNGSGSPYQDLSRHPSQQPQHHPPPLQHQQHHQPQPPPPPQLQQQQMMTGSQRVQPIPPEFQTSSPPVQRPPSATPSSLVDRNPPMYPARSQPYPSPNLGGGHSGASSPRMANRADQGRPGQMPSPYRIPASGGGSPGHGPIASGGGAPPLGGQQHGKFMGHHELNGAGGGRPPSTSGSAAPPVGYYPTSSPTSASSPHPPQPLHGMPPQHPAQQPQQQQQQQQQQAPSHSSHSPPVHPIHGAPGRSGSGGGVGSGGSYESPGSHHPHHPDQISSSRGPSGPAMYWPAAPSQSSTSPSPSNGSPSHLSGSSAAGGPGSGSGRPGSAGGQPQGPAYHAHAHHHSHPPPPASHGQPPHSYYSGTGSTFSHAAPPPHSQQQQQPGPPPPGHYYAQQASQSSQQQQRRR